VNSGTPSDTTKLPPPSQSDLFERDVQPWRAAHRDLQVIRVHGDGLEPLLDEDAALEVGGLGPESLDIHLPEDAGHFFEFGGQV
jgi:hypothetical protein